MSNRENLFSPRAPRRTSQTSAPLLRPRVPPPPISPLRLSENPFLNLSAPRFSPIAQSEFQNPIFSRRQPNAPVIRPRNPPVVNPFLNLSPINIPPSRPFVHQSLTLSPTGRSVLNQSRSNLPHLFNPNVTAMNVLQQQVPLSPDADRFRERWGGIIRSRPRTPRP